MRRIRIRLTIKRTMSAIAVASLLLGLFVYDRRARVRRALNQAMASYLQLSQELEFIDGEIALATADLRRCEDRVATYGKNPQSGGVSKAQYLAFQLAVQKARFELEQAKVKRVVLFKGKPKSLVSLKTEIEELRGRLAAMGGAP